MKGLAKGRVSKAALLGILFFAAGCGSKDEESPPNYVVREVYTGTTAQGSQKVTEPPQDQNSGQASLGNSIVREEVADAAGAENGADVAGTGDGAEGSDVTGTGDGTDGLDAAGTGDGANEAVTDEKAWKKPQTDQALPGGAAEDLQDAAPGQAFPERAQEDGDSGFVQALPEKTPPQANAEKAEQVDVMSVDGMSLLPAGTVVEVGTFSKEELAACFYTEEVSDAVFRRMEGNSYGEDCTVSLSELRYVRVLHYGFDGEVHIGELVVNQAIAQDIRDIFAELFDAGYPVEKILLIDTYGGDDDASMTDNNTSSFNFRRVEGGASLSRHAYGLAVDINPLYNPYIPIRDGVQVVLPAAAAAYADREADCEYYIRQGDVCYEAFVSRGFTWGGDWTAGKDYQHFSKTVE